MLNADQRAWLEAQAAALTPTLLTWFAGHARDLPWRRERTPYRVWLAEIMLQQTQVETVRAYYQRFLERFPTLEALAQAPLEDVLRVWEGLGYYRRAQALHRTARLLVEEHGGAFPADPQALRRLPGIGAYTAGAIASLAFGIATPAVDGNVRRVLARLLASPRMDSAAAEEAVRLLLPTDRAGAFNEALMELGALICRPRAPQCADCPWQALCQGRASGTPEAFPQARQARALPHYDVVAAVILREDGQVLVAQRPREAMLGGLWEFPGGKCEPGESLPAALERELREELDIAIAVGERLTVVPHAYTHFRITLHAFLCRLVAGEPRCLACADWRWIQPEVLASLPMAVTDRRIARAFLAHPTATSSPKKRPGF